MLDTHVVLVTVSGMEPLFDDPLTPPRPAGIDHVVALTSAVAELTRRHRDAATLDSPYGDLVASTRIVAQLAEVASHVAAINELFLTRAVRLTEAQECDEQTTLDAVALVTAVLGVDDDRPDGPDYGAVDQMLVELRRRGEADVLYPHMVLESLAVLMCQLLDLAAWYRHLAEGATPVTTYEDRTAMLREFLARRPD